MTLFGNHRRTEVDRSGNLTVAEHVAAKAGRRPTLTYEELKAAVAEGLAPPDPPRQAVHEALDDLQRLDFVWRPPGQAPPARDEPGIPSLMDRTLRLLHAPASRPPLQAHFRSRNAITVSATRVVALRSRTGRASSP